MNIKYLYRNKLFNKNILKYEKENFKINRIRFT